MAGHLTLEEREMIAHEHRAGRMQTQIADGSDPKPCLRIMFPVLTGLPIVSC